MKILHVEGGRNLYGGAHQLLLLMEGLKALGHENHLICRRATPLAEAAMACAEVSAIDMGGDLDFSLIVRLHRLIRASRPDIVHLNSRIGADVMGGIAARLAGIPLLVHEQNRAAGLTNKVLAAVARQVLVGFPQTFAREVHVGNPVRAQIAQVPPPAARDFAHAGPLRLLVLGGSQGARALNRAVPQAVAALGLPVAVVHQAGEKLLDEARAAYAEAGVAAQVEPFIADMAAAYAHADLVVCRAGALTLAELCAVGVGSVLVPFPQAVDDHQTRNAEFLVERGAAVLLPQSDQLAARLRDVLAPLSADAGKRLAMARAARALARPDAAQRVAEAVLAAIPYEVTR